MPKQARLSFPSRVLYQRGHVRRKDACASFKHKKIALLRGGTTRLEEEIDVNLDVLSLLRRRQPVNLAGSLRLIGSGGRLLKARRQP